MASIQQQHNHNQSFQNRLLVVVFLVCMAVMLMARFTLGQPAEPGTPGASGASGTATGSAAPSTTRIGTTGLIGGRPLRVGGCASGTAAVTGVSTAMALVVTPVSYPGDAVFWKGYVSGTNKVTVKVCVGLETTPGITVYNVRAIQ